MPELPEVEVVRAGLEPAVTGALITSVEVREPRSLKRHDAAAGAFDARLEGRMITAACRRGKFLWLPLLGLPPHGTPREADAAPRPAPRDALLVHLGMSGQVLLREPGADDDRNLRIRLGIEHAEHGELRVDFVDQRIFGSMAVDALVPTADGMPGGRGSDQPTLPTQVAHIGRDPLDPAFDDDAFIATLRKRPSGIKRVLLDQGVASGIGNIYADEALWAARIHYDQPAATLGTKRARLLLAEVRLVLAKALAEGGTSFDAQYVNVNGASGYFSHSLNAYGRQGTPCARCGTLLVRERFMNRASHLCPRCQRLRVPARAAAIRQVP
ncbi:bifunctional DNA-formamidopyrimidine glycosylase/DNA-(apurinic or apyrimidinic site) lyase [Microbacterium sp. STN6]|uniref:bifunctional DNA-formamidopyrimidine glycosylase/DNA-(apurinic or apyrimidinic site) lyase n=1 Tax=Microbacterium sp. STN6 TaxID=2995588 RepID=UPI002260DD27|nr:bifunctional DNA-formamidopyrimidine glycosylase/DNA-(apurinic or apyrimidinic site) lyase [Microbacterium sp. STN6]MCX7522103.1 bifunctional DNA-formamidopyrimidine glycosylase/DNA-(apurinic or apyrimidinic site) lyase [Microbacterium sp. STN6]